MIVTVTMNPALDKTAALDELTPRGLNRLGEVRRDVGGKGINVSRAVAALGGSSLCTGFLAGETGRAMERALEEMEGLEPRFLFVPGETRTNLKIMEPDGSLTEFNEPGPDVTRALPDLAALLEELLSAGDVVVLSGSAGPGTPDTAYRALTELAHRKGARVFVDADGPLLEKALEAGPDLIKPNGYELGKLLGRPGSDVAELARMALELNRRGVGTVCVSLGGDGALFVHGGKALRAKGLKMEVRSTVGCGDTMVAALAYALNEGMAPGEGFRLAMAASAAACTTQGTCPPDRALVDRLLPEIKIEPLGA